MKSLIGESLIGESLIGESLIGESPFGQWLIGQLPFRGFADQVAIDANGRAKFAIDGFLVGAALGREIGRGYRVT